VLAAQIYRDAGLVLLQNPDDLLFRKAAALHALVLVLGQNELQSGLTPGGKVTKVPIKINILIFWRAARTQFPGELTNASSPG